VNTDTTTTCENCKGTGQVVNPNNNTRGNCWTCMGTGHGDEICQACNCWNWEHTDQQWRDCISDPEFTPDQVKPTPGYKTVQVPDNWCDTCSGKGTRALGGQAFSAQEIYQWSPDEVETYISGGYDTRCEVCNGTGQVSQTDADYFYETQAIYRAETGYTDL